MDLIEKRVIDYINDVDDKSSAPGGGSVASLVGALGIALAKMLAHFSFDKKKFKDADEKKKNQFITAFNELDQYKDELIKGVDDDAISYNAVMKAYASKDQEEIQKALNYSAFVALEMQRSAYNAIRYAEKLVVLGNKYLYSDLVSAAILLVSCVEMASLNVIANASSIKDEQVKNDYLTKSNKFILNSKNVKRKIIRSINSK